MGKTANPEDVNAAVAQWYLNFYVGLGDGYESSTPRLSADGRYVAFESEADLVEGDNNNKRDIFVRDLWEGSPTWSSATCSVNRPTPGCGKDDGSTGPAITPSYDDVVPQVSFFSGPPTSPS